MKFSIILVLFAFSIIFIIPDAFGKHGNIYSDKEVYYPYEIIKITGDVGFDMLKTLPTEIGVQIDSNYSKKLYSVIVDVDKNGKFYHEVDIKNLDGLLTYPIDDNTFYMLGMMGGHESYQDIHNSAYTLFQIGDVERYNILKSFKNGEPQFTFDDKTYTSNDSIIITGNVTDNQHHYVDIFDPDGTLVGEGIFRRDSPNDNTVMVEFDLNNLGVNKSYPYQRPLTDGTYTMKIGNSPGINNAEYGTYEFDFIFSDLLSKQLGDEIKINFDKKFYTQDDFIIINGTIPEKFIYDTALTMTVKDPYGELIIDTEIRPQRNGYFYKSLFTENDFTITGDYTFELHGKYLSEPITKIIKYHNPNFVDVRKLDSQVQTIDSDVTQLRSDTDTLRTDVDSLQIQFNNFQKFVNEQLEIIFNIFSESDPKNS